MSRAKYRVVWRWKVRNRVHRNDLAAALNKLAKDGWDICDVMACFGSYTVVAKRKVRERL